MAESPAPFTFKPIGFIRSPFRLRIEAPHQPTVQVEGDDPGEAFLDLDPDLPEETLRDLEGFAYVWVIFVLHRSEGWAPTVRPPRGPRVKRGVFATRSPHRPNPIGLSAVELAGVEGRTLRLRGVDLLDGTPVLDIKPYVPYADAFPQARAGWIDAVDAATGLCSAPGLRRPRKAR
jgi:tRNA (adenine37-N6)-methyltransferase